MTEVAILHSCVYALNTFRFSAWIAIILPCPCRVSLVILVALEKLAETVPLVPMETLDRLDELDYLDNQ